MRSIVVSFSTNILVNVLTALIAFRLLRQFRFSVRESVLGVLALMFCTTHLHYTQNMMENNYIMLLTLTGFSFQYEWLRTGSKRALLVQVAAALGLNLLTRLTTGLDLMAAGFFLLLVLWFEQVRGREVWRRLVAYCKVAGAGVCVFPDGRPALPVLPLWIVYQHLSRRWLPSNGCIDPTLPANFPWTTPFHEGFLGALFKPEKSIFLFDPLLVLAILLLVRVVEAPVARNPRLWRDFAAAACLPTSAFMRRYAYWAGDFAWGDRYVSTAVELAALLAVPLLLRYRENLSAWIWRGGLVLIAASLVIQFASLAFWMPLEIYQMETLGHPTFVIALRFKNIVAFALGKMDAWGLNNEAMTGIDWDYVHITTWNFLPFLLRRVGAAPGWVVKVAFGIWVAGIGGLLLTLERLRRRLVEW